MSREEAFPALLNEKRLHGIGVEVGVWRGDFSEAILSRWPGAIFCMVDPWRAQPFNDYPDPTIQGADWPGVLAAAKRVCERHRPRVHMMRMTSLDAATDHFKDRDCDWVYLDAVHTFEAVTADLRAWVPRVRAGGIIAGHDYIKGHRADIQVVEAVHAFFGPRDISIIEDAIPSWYVEL
jgi:Methyltransferase domain